MQKILSKLRFLASIFLFSGALFLIGCDDDDDPVTPVDISGTITGLVQSSSQFTLLETAILNVSANTTSDLATLFSTTGTGTPTYTVFAPNDAAFTAAGFDASFLGDAGNAEAILAILQYHVINGSVPANAVPAGPNQSQATLSSDNVFFTVNTEGVVNADINAENGVIHEIGAVLEVPSTDIIGTALTAPGDFTLLVTAIVNASANSGTDVEGVLSGTTDYTVFAPTSQAFLDAGFDYAFLSDAANASAILDILLYHVINGEVVSTAVPAGPNAEQATLLTDANIYLTNNTDGVFVNANQVAIANVDASNGVIHAIGAVLTPPVGNIVETAQDTDALASLVAAITYVDNNTSAGLATALSSGAFTVFAPTNDAFLAVFDGADGSMANGTIETAELDVLGGERIADILRLHVVNALAFSIDLSDAQELPTLLADENLTIGINGSTVSVSGAGNMNPSTVASANIVTTSGFVHVIDQVLLPETNIVELAQYNADLSMLVAAIVNASTNSDTDIAGTLSGMMEYTVFAPTNQAFIDAGFNMTFLSDAANADAIRDILLYHVLNDETKANAVPAGPNANLPALGGGDVYLTSNSNGVFINGTAVTMADLDADNGVIHKIGTVLTPPVGTVVDAVVGDSDLSLLLQVIQYVDNNSSNTLASTLSGTGPFTIFAPTNAAFLAALDTDTNGTLEESELDALGATALADILLTHVLDGRIFSSDLTDDATVTPLNTAESLTIDLSNGAQVSSDNTSNANITTVNIVGTNGAIHKIDAVLLP